MLVSGRVEDVSFFVFVDEVAKILASRFNGPCLYNRSMTTADVGEDPWFPFVTNALNAKELYIKDKALLG